jgi:hypothetical protein
MSYSGAGVFCWLRWALLVRAFVAEEFISDLFVHTRYVLLNRHSLLRSLFWFFSLCDQSILTILWNLSILFSKFLRIHFPCKLQLTICFSLLNRFLILFIVLFIFVEYLFTFIHRLHDLKYKYVVMNLKHICIL